MRKAFTEMSERTITLPTVPPACTTYKDKQTRDQNVTSGLFLIRFKIIFLKKEELSRLSSQLSDMSVTRAAAAHLVVTDSSFISPLFR